MTTPSPEHSSMDNDAWKDDEPVTPSTSSVPPNPHRHVWGPVGPPTRPVGSSGATKVLEDLHALQERVRVLEDHLTQLHRIVVHQGERLNRLDPPLHHGHPGQ